jgi:shikimate dehydrogenase
MNQDRYAVAGNPVEHSRSPAIHAAFAEQTGQPVEYGRLLCPLDDFEGHIRRFAASGGKGCNVTVPFKFEAFKLAQTLTPRALLAQAVNTLRFDATGWVGDNTDGVGLVRDIERNAGRPLKGLEVLLIGAGGAAAGVLGSLIEAGPAQIWIVNRSRDKAEQLAHSHAHLGVPLQAGGLADAPTAQDVVVNATATSLAGVGSPVDARVIKPGGLALDMMYGPKAQGFLDWAAQHGAEPRDGLGMLVEQAAEAFHFWRGVRPDTAPVLAALRAQL